MSSGERKFNFYSLYMVIIGITLVVYLINLIRNREWLFSTPFFYATPDATFYFYVISLILGIFLLYRLTVFYRKYGSTEYLLLGLIFFGTIVSLFLWQTWELYLSPLSSMLFSGDLDFNTRGYPELLLFQFNFFVADALWIIHGIRLHGYKNASRFHRIFFFILVYAHVFRLLNITAFGLDLIFNPEKEFFSLRSSNPWYQKIHAFYWLFELFGLERLRGALAIVLTTGVLTTIYMIYAYLTLKTQGNKRIARTSQLLWILAFTLSMVFGLLQVSWILGILDLQPLNTWEFFLAVGSTLSLLPLIILLALYPEGLLITEQQIVRAGKLYTVLSPDKQEKSSGLTSIFNYESHLSDYIKSLPPELLKGGGD